MLSIVAFFVNPSKIASISLTIAGFSDAMLLFSCGSLLRSYRFIFSEDSRACLKYLYLEVRIPKQKTLDDNFAKSMGSNNITEFKNTGQKFT